MQAPNADCRCPLTVRRFLPNHHADDTEGIARVSMNPTSQTDVSPDAIDSAPSWTFASLPASSFGDVEAGSQIDAAAGADGPLGSCIAEGNTKIDSIEFRVLRAGSPVRRLRLTGSRYTFGSAEGCSIRLSDNSLRPMHAVLIRDAHRILVRAYSVPIEVNDDRTTEATLDVGDVLRMGAYRFELLSLSTHSESAFAAAPFASPPSSVLDRNVDRYSSASARELPPQDDGVWRERLRREVEQWRTRQAQCDQRESRCDDREANLRGRESELWARAEQLYRREAQLQSQEAATMQIHEEYAQKQQELIRLHEQSHSRQKAYERRDSEYRTLENHFRQQEIAYRSQIEEASEQLQQSQQQAEAATEAVQRMREQFVSLNQQIDELSSLQEHFQQQEQSQREEYKRLCRELEAARDQALDAKAESEALRQQAEQRVEEMAARIDEFKSGPGSDLEAQKARLEESEALALQLFEQVDELQKSVADARQESAQLRADYEQACESVRDLERHVSEGDEQANRDREKWAADAEQLREKVQQLSAELTRANGELSDLRDANNALTARLDDMRRERDEIKEEAETRPTAQAWQSLQQELDCANEQFAVIKQEYDATVARLEEDSANQLAQLEALPSDDRDELILAQDQDTDQDTDEQGPEIRLDNAGDSVEYDARPISQHADPIVADSPQADWPSPSAASTVSPDEETVSPDEEDESAWPAVASNDSLWSSNANASRWNDESSQSASDSIDPASDPASDQASDPSSDQAAELESSDPWQDAGDMDSLPAEQSDDDSLETTSPWGAVEDLESDESNPWDSTAPRHETADSFWPPSSPEPESSSSEVDDDQEDVVEGSLASMLIQDLDASDSDDGEHDGTYLMANGESGDWDQEHPEELLASSWKNDSEGYRSESIDEVNRLDDDLDDAVSSDDEIENADSELTASHHEQVDVDDQPEDVVLEPPTAIGDGVASAMAEGDDSIEAYMNRLLQRVQGESDSDGPQPDTVVLAASTSGGKPIMSNPSDWVDDVEQGPDSPFVPRSEAPEKHSNLSAMRQLANETVRTAISRSERVQSRDTQLKGLTKFAFAVIALICGFACFSFIPGAMRYVAIAMTIIVAAICVYEGLYLFGEAKRHLAANEPQPDGKQPDAAVPTEEALVDHAADEAVSS